MPAFLVAFVPFLTWILVSAAGRIVAAFGLSVISYAGLSYLTDGLFDYAVSLTNGLSSDLATFVRMFGVLSGLKLITSAYIARFTIGGMHKFIIG